MWKDTLCQALLIHREGIYLKAFDPAFDRVKEFLVHPVFHVAEGNVRVGAFTGVHDLHGEFWVAYVPADQGCVEDQRFHKTVPGTPHDLVFIWFLRPSGRVGAAVDGDTLIVAVDQRQDTPDRS